MESQYSGAVRSTPNFYHGSQISPVLIDYGPNPSTSTSKADSLSATGTRTILIQEFVEDYLTNANATEDDGEEIPTKGTGTARKKTNKPKGLGRPLRDRGWTPYKWSPERIRVYQAEGWEVPSWAMAEDSPSHRVWSHAAAPPNLCMEGLEGIEFTAREMLTFLPALVGAHGVMHRLASNGWKPTDIANCINDVWAVDQADGVLADTMKHQLKASDMAYYNGLSWTKYWKAKGIASIRPPVHDFTPSKWYKKGATLKFWDKNYKVDPFLAGLADGIPPEKFPTGDDAKLLTKGILYAIRNDLHHLRLSDLPALALDDGFTATVAIAPMGPDADLEALIRHRQAHVMVAEAIAAKKAEKEALATLNGGDQSEEGTEDGDAV
ncbi:hypothetical protein M011DRAFT_472353 [Sporormia fimetaria CBS 119925]|uniref:Uncharacterized protein n=1 Tax=Sporormia fimetaria CBS 119925 TaxID=1340428 RepID=A0A6A6UXS5_9PLEO|nr:hypothetical protein M011DRAFT_472353 [Sporormia fimetaria CBS 119925]